MAKVDDLDVPTSVAERQRRAKPIAGVFPRQINVAWTSITANTLQPGELVYNRSDGSLVIREDHDTIFRFDNAATRTI